LGQRKYFICKLVCIPILQAKWSNKQKSKVLCIKVHFFHFYPSNECCVKRHYFFPQLVCVYCVCVYVCVCVLFFSHTPKAKTQNFFFLLGMGGDIIYKKDKWWVYWLLIVYTLLLPWQFSTLIYIYFNNVEIFKFLFIFPPSNKKVLKENIENSRKFYLVEMIFQITYLYIWQTFFEACYQSMFLKKKLINYLTNISSTCQGNCNTTWKGGGGGVRANRFLKFSSNHSSSYGPLKGKGDWCLMLSVPIPKNSFQKMKKSF
jgi:hypothetical protein